MGASEIDRFRNSNCIRCYSVLLFLFINGLSVSSVAVKKPHVAVIGAGWGGWGAAKSLCENGCRVTLLDAIPDPTGSTPYLTPTGKPFEPGTRGFWKDYPNINNLLHQLSLSADDIFTSFTNSSFYSPFGLEATAPVFSSSSLPTLPSPLGQVFATFQLFERLPLADRASMAGLLAAMVDYTRSEETFEAYDKMTAFELFQKFGVSKRLVDDFIRPTLLVGLFKPPEELSASVTMELLYYYALAHQTSFDVRWIKGRSISETIIAPMAKALKQKYGDDLTILGGARVDSVSVSKPSSDTSGTRKSVGKGRSSLPHVTGLTYSTRSKSGNGGLGRDTHTLEDIDACVFALGAKGLRGLLSGSPELASVSSELTRAASLGSIDVMACRLWLDKKVTTRSPANVLSRFPQLRGAGGTFFMLDQLQGDTKEGEDMLWASGGTEEQERGSVVACDFYNAAALLPLSDEDIVSTLIGSNDEDSTTTDSFPGLLPSAVPAFKGAKVVDYYVQRYPGAVSWFSPGSYTLRPPLQLSELGNCVCAGDWVRMGSREYGAKGLCQERAFVSGIEAANALARSGVLARAALKKMDPSDEPEKLQHLKEAKVLPIRDDELQFILLRAFNKGLRDTLSSR